MACSSTKWEALTTCSRCSKTACEKCAAPYCVHCYYRGPHGQCDVCKTVGWKTRTTCGICKKTTCGRCMRSSYCAHCRVKVCPHCLTICDHCGGKYCPACSARNPATEQP